MTTKTYSQLVSHSQWVTFRYCPGLEPVMLHKRGKKLSMWQRLPEPQQPSASLAYMSIWAEITRAEEINHILTQLIEHYGLDYVDAQFKKLGATRAQM